MANCDPWFKLEVRDLPWAVVAHLGCTATARLTKPDLDAAYNALRRRVIDSGDEIDALSAVVEILAEYDVVLERRVVIKAIDELMLAALTSLEPVAGIAETVRHLHARDCRLGVISSAVHHQFVEWSIRKMDLGDAFSSIVTSASAGYYKSSPRIYQHSLRELNATPGQATHVGDSVRWDVGGAQQAGMNAIWLDTGRPENRTSSLSINVTPDLTITSMEGAGPLIYAFAVWAEHMPDD